MTVTTQTNRIDHVGTGSATLFPYNFLVYEDSHLEVYLDGVLTTTGFTINNDIPNSNGDITFDVAPASGVAISIIRVVPLTQLLDYTAFGPFPAETHEKGLDLGVMRDQQNAESDNHELRVPFTDPIPGEVPEVSIRATKLLGFDANGDPRVSDSTVDDVDAVVAAAVGEGSLMSSFSFVGDGVTTDFVLGGITITHAASILAYIDGISQNPEVDYNVVVVGGSTTVTFTTAPPNLSDVRLHIVGFSKPVGAADAGNITYRAGADRAGFPDGVVRQLDDVLDDYRVSVKDWGAKGDGVTDDHAAIQQCMNSNAQGDIYFPEGIYIISDTLVIAGAAQNLLGEGQRSNLQSQGFVSGQPMITNIGDAIGRRNGQRIKGFSFFGDPTLKLGIGIDLAYSANGIFQDLWFQFLETRMHFGEDCFLNTFINHRGSGTTEVAYHANRFGFNSNVFNGVAVGGKGFLMELLGASGAMAGNAFIGCSWEGNVEDLALGVTGAFTATNNTSGELSGIMGLTFSGCYWEANDVPAVSLNAGGISGQSFNGIAGVSINGCFATGGSNDHAFTKSIVFLEAFGVNGISIVGNHFDDFGTALVADFGGNNGWNFEGNSIGVNSIGVSRIPQFRSDGPGTALGGSGGYVKNIGLLVRRELQGLAPPVSGDYIKGDILWNSQPDAGEYEKWICVTAGTPGTWKGVGFIQLESTYQPVVSGTTSGGWNVNADTQDLSITRIGQIVFIQGRIFIDSANAPVGDLQINLPFVPSSVADQSGRINCFTTLVGHGGTVENAFFQITPPGAFAALVNVTDAGVKTFPTLDASFEFSVNIMYTAVP